MKLERGHTYDLWFIDGMQNGDGKQLPKALIQEVAEYKGDYIVSGQRYSYQDHVFRGFTDVGGAPVVFVVPKHELVQQNILNFSIEVGGNPLALKEGDALLYIVNWDYLFQGVMWQHKIERGMATLSKLRDQATEVIDLYQAWRERGIMPASFTVKKELARSLPGSADRPPLAIPGPQQWRGLTLPNGTLPNLN